MGWWKKLVRDKQKYAIRVLGTPELRYIMKGNSIQKFATRDEAEVVSKKYAGSTVVVEI